METLTFGSRSGSWFALLLFTAVFGAVAVTAARQMRERGASRRLARAVGGPLWLGPVLAIYVSSLGGFYEMSLDRSVVRLEYLFPGNSVEIPFSEIVGVRAAPWYRGRDRLLLIGRSGRTYESATWHRREVSDAALRLQQRLGLPPDRR